MANSTQRGRVITALLLFTLPLLLSACSNGDVPDEPAADDAGVEVLSEPVKVSMTLYLPVADNATRADDDYWDKTESGISYENWISSCRVLIFGADGSQILCFDPYSPDSYNLVSDVTFTYSDYSYQEWNIEFSLKSVPTASFSVAVIANIPEVDADSAESGQLTYADIEENKLTWSQITDRWFYVTDDDYYIQNYGYPLPMYGYKEFNNGYQFMIRSVNNFDDIVMTRSVAKIKLQLADSLPFTIESVSIGNILTSGKLMSYYDSKSSSELGDHGSSFDFTVSSNKRSASAYVPCQKSGEAHYLTIKLRSTAFTNITHEFTESLATIVKLDGKSDEINKLRYSLQSNDYVKISVVDVDGAAMKLNVSTDSLADVSDWFYTIQNWGESSEIKENSVEFEKYSGDVVVDNDSKTVLMGKDAVVKVTLTFGVACKWSVSLAYNDETDDVFDYVTATGSVTTVHSGTADVNGTAVIYIQCTDNGDEHDVIFNVAVKAKESEGSYADSSQIVENLSGWTFKSIL